MTPIKTMPTSSLPKVSGLVAWLLAICALWAATPTSARSLLRSSHAQHTARSLSSETVDSMKDVDQGEDHGARLLQGAAPRETPSPYELSEASKRIGSLINAQTANLWDDSTGLIGQDRVFSPAGAITSCMISSSSTSYTYVDSFFSSSESWASSLSVQSDVNANYFGLSMKASTTFSKVATGTQNVEIYQMDNINPQSSFVLDENCKSRTDLNPELLADWNALEGKIGALVRSACP